MTDLRNAIARAIDAASLRRLGKSEAYIQEVMAIVPNASDTGIAIAAAVLSTLSAMELVVVPREPTKAMAQECVYALDTDADIWTAMISASPYFPKGE